MDVILILSGKGGAGETTLARELAVAGVEEGRHVAIVDMDPQVGLTGWYGRRAADTPTLVKMPPRYDLAELSQGGVDELIIDLPPGLPAYVPTLIGKADVVLVPVRASPDDLLTVPAVVEALAKHPSWAFILNQTPPRSRLVDGTLRQLAAWGGWRQLAWVSGRIFRLPPSKVVLRWNLLARSQLAKLSSYVAT